MSKRHTSSRRKTYGRRQHEVRERQDRGQHSRRLRVRARRLGLRPARPTRSASSIRAARASASPSATERWPSTRAPALAPSDCRAPDGSPRVRASTAAASAARSGPAARRTGSGLVLGAIVVAFMLAFFSLAQQVRVSATGLDIGRLELDRQNLDDTAADIRSDLNRSAANPRSASKPSMRASGSCPTRSS